MRFGHFPIMNPSSRSIPKPYPPIYLNVHSTHYSASIPLTLTPYFLYPLPTYITLPLPTHTSLHTSYLLYTPTLNPTNHTPHLLMNSTLPSPSPLKPYHNLQHTLIHPILYLLPTTIPYTMQHLQSTPHP